MSPSPWVSRIARVVALVALATIVVTGLMDIAQGKGALVVFLAFVFLVMALAIIAFALPQRR